MDEYEAVDAGDGLSIYVHRTLMSAVDGEGGCSFAFGLFGRCSITAPDA